MQKVCTLIFSFKFVVEEIEIEMKMLRVFAFFLSAGLCSALPFVDMCPKLKSESGFNIQKFSGQWFETARTWYSKTLDTKCHNETYLYDKRQGRINITAGFINRKFNNTLASIGFGNYQQSTPGRWQFFFQEADSTGFMTVLKTDYTKFAVIYSCVTAEAYRLDYAWAVSRKRILSSRDENAIMAIFQKEVSKVYTDWRPNVVVVDQKHCPLRRQTHK